MRDARARTRLPRRNLTGRDADDCAGEFAIVQLRWLALLIALCCFGSGCGGTRAVLAEATGHDPSGPPGDFALELREAFLLPQGGVLLYGTSRSMMGEETSWITELRADSVRAVEKPGRSGLKHRIVVRWSDWHPTPEPLEPAILPTDPTRHETMPTAADRNACTFAGALGQRSRKLAIMHARETFTPGTPVAIPMDDRIRPARDETQTRAQLILRDLPAGAFKALSKQGGHLEVVFLEDQTPVQPVKLLMLPWAAAADGGASLIALVRMGPDRLMSGSTAYRAEQARKFGREKGCHCIVTRTRGAPVPSCYEPTW
jgi:hypothetical protein